MANKDRLLFLMKTLQEQSDEKQWISSTQLCRFLKEQQLDSQVRTLRKDIQALKDSGFEICERKREGMSTEYSWQDREWSAPELQVLIDAVSSAQFIPQERSEDMVSRLAAMAGPSHAGTLRPQILISEHIKAKNRNMIYSVQAIRRAIDRDRKIVFRYLRYTTEKKQVPKHAGSAEEDYIVSPYATVWNNDRYYLVGWSEKRKKVTTYRIDRMEVPRQLKAKRVPPPEDFDVRDYTDKVFWMFDGPVEEVTLRCRMSILDQVIDRFGDGVQIRKVDTGLFDVTVPVSVSGTFFAWVFQFTGEMKILEPRWVREKYAGVLEDAMDAALG